VDRVEQRVIHVEKNKKKALLVELLSDAAMSRTLVFTRTKRGADRVAKHLDAAGIDVAAIHGNKSQSQREIALAAFKSGRIRVLVATDIAARGIDVDQVSHVVNFELPEVPEAYVHRIGRTARAGASGFALAFCDGEERGLLRDIERLTRLSIPSQDRRNDASLAADRPAGSDRPPGGLNGRRDGRGRHAAAAGKPAQGNGGRDHRGRANGGHDRAASGRDRRDDRRPRDHDRGRGEQAYPEFGDVNRRPIASRETSSGSGQRWRDGAGQGRGPDDRNGRGERNRERLAANGKQHRKDGAPRHNADRGRNGRGDGEGRTLNGVAFLSRDAGEGRSRHAGPSSKGGHRHQRQGAGGRDGGRPRAGQ
jgi:ATP-dependent RNA helicase RhlE